MNPYLKMQVETATPVERVVLLYDRLALLLKEALEALEVGDTPRRINSIAKAERIVQVLNSSLDFEAGGEVARALRNFYETLLTGMFVATREAEPQVLKNLIMMVEEVRGAWEEVKSKV